MILCPALASHRPEFLPFLLWLFCAQLCGYKQVIHLLSASLPDGTACSTLSFRGCRAQCPASSLDSQKFASPCFTASSVQSLLHVFVPLAIASWCHIPVLESNFRASGPGKPFSWLNGFVWWPSILFLSVWLLRYFGFFCSSTPDSTTLALNLSRVSIWTF